MKFFYRTLFILFVLIKEVNATISCVDVNSCLLLKEISPKGSSSEILIKKIKDPHHFHPSQKQLKKMLKASKLILAPLELSPWQRSVINKKANQSKLIILSTKHSPIKANLEALSHFWLHPKLICFQKIALATQLKEKWQMKITPPSCDKEEIIQKHFEALKEKFSNKKLVLTHNALEPLLKNVFGNVLALKGSHHGENITTKSIKELVTFKKESKEKKNLYWIIEEQIGIPRNVKNMLGKDDKVLYIKSTLSQNDNIYTVLNTLLAKLREI